MDIIITIPKTTDEKIFKEELKLTNNGDYDKNIKLHNLPKNLKIGENCHFIYKGMYIGYMHVSDFSTEPFLCSTTGKHFYGKFLKLSGGLYQGGLYEKFKNKNNFKGFQGFRYLDQWLKNL